MEWINKWTILNCMGLTGPPPKKKKNKNKNKKWKYCSYRRCNEQNIEEGLWVFVEPWTWTKDGLNRISGILNLSAPISIVLFAFKSRSSDRKTRYSISKCKKQTKQHSNWIILNCMGLTGRQEAHMESLECLSMNFLNL